ncbi:DUF4340 domain-containing protein [Caldovatus aquaticus]|uniref:DUF4340 domain-containing protein n=1 Tax=Caldovatus aquaticus TaxID=2865671 RepID=A0ABS7EYZ6_9PROT|nr:DUF4340 domain-containing protein [Caldovatus aquaticus]MBW8268514.1 DUF4340 domain-containing protein [Caldovatus aquaticus]
MRRRTLVLLGGAAALVAGAAVLLTPGTTPPPAPSDGALAFPGLAERLQRAAAIEVRRHDGTLRVERQGETWVLPDKAHYPARPERVRELLTGLTELRLAERRTSDPALLDRLGLEDPERPGATSSLLRVLDAQGAPLAELVVGRRRVRTQGNVPESAYVRRPDETQAWLAEGRIPVDADAQLWLDRDLANLPPDRLRRVVVRRAGTAELVLTRAGDADARLALAQPAEHPPLDETSLDEVARGFEFLTFLEVRPEAEIPGEPLGEARFEFTDNLAVTVRPYKADALVWIRLSAEGDEEAARLNARWRGWAYQVGQWKEKAFVPRLEDLLRQEAGAAPEAPAGAAPAAAPGDAPQ